MSLFGKLYDIYQNMDEKNNRYKKSEILDRDYYQMSIWDWTEGVDEILEERECVLQPILQEKTEEERHILEVTSMELPLEWENFYDTDELTTNVFVESVSLKAGKQQMNICPAIYNTS